MGEYLELDLTADAEQLRQGGRDWLEGQSPAGYVIDPLTDWILGAVARMASEITVIAGRVPLEIFKVFGQRVLGIPALDATSALGTVTVTAADTAGHTIAAGTQLGVEGIGFVTASDVVIAPGANTATLTIVAIAPGADGSGLSGAAELVAPTYTWWSSAVVVGTTTGGVDGEDDDDYVDRLADELPTLSPKAILIEDFEALARRDLEVVRALAIDNLVPPSTTGVEGAVTVAIHNETGQPVSSAAKTRVEQALEASRVLNLDVHVIDPTYTQVDVAFTATAYADSDPAVVKAAGEQAIAELLSPAVWGSPNLGAANAWVNEPTIVRNDLIGALYRVPGLRHVSALTLGAHGGSLSTSDMALTGPAALPVPLTITGTVT